MRYDEKPGTPAASDQVDRDAAVASRLITIVVHERGPSSAIVEVTGEIDMLTAPRLQAAFGDLLGRGHQIVVADLSRVLFLGSSGLAVLISAHQEAADRGGQFRLVSPGPPVARTIEATGLTGLFTTFGSLHEATSDLPA